MNPEKIKQIIDFCTAFFFKDFDGTGPAEDVIDAKNSLTSTLRASSLAEPFKAVVETTGPVPCRALLESLGFTKLSHRDFPPDTKMEMNFETGKVVLTANGEKKDVSDLPQEELLPTPKEEQAEVAA